jgi:hypothetical protein
MLQDLINHATGPNAIIHEDEYFLCTEEFLEKSLAWTEKEQRGILAELEERGYINRDKRGVPGRRFVRVNVEKIEMDLDEYYQRSEFPPSQFRPKGGTGSGQKGGTGSGQKGGTNIYEIRIDELHNSTPLRGGATIEENGQSSDPKEVMDQKEEEIQPEEPRRPRKGSALPDPIFFNWSEMLHSAAEKKSGRRIRKTLVVSARAFQSILDRVGDPERIMNALSFYRSKDIINRDGTKLVITNPLHFERCLDWIENEMKKSATKKLPVVPRDPNRHDDVI